MFLSIILPSCFSFPNTSHELGLNFPWIQKLLLTLATLSDQWEIHTRINHYYDSPPIHSHTIQPMSDSDDTGTDTGRNHQFHLRDNIYTQHTHMYQHQSTILPTVPVEAADQTSCLTLSQWQYTDTGPVSPAVTLKRQVLGRIAIRIPIFKSLVWLDQAKQGGIPDLLLAADDLPLGYQGYLLF